VAARRKFPAAKLRVRHEGEILLLDGVRLDGTGQGPVGEI
jgi:hypothetical protein